MRDTARSVFSCLAACTAVACASQPGPDLSYLDQQRAKTLAQPQGLLIDTCVVRDVLTPQDHVVWSSTRRSEDLAETNLRAVLIDQGARLPADSLFTVCAQSQSRTADRWAAAPGDAVRTDAPPWAGRNTDAERLATRALQSAVQATIRGADTQYRQRRIALSPTAANVLRQRLQADRVWVLTLAGIDVSPSKQLSKPAIGALLVFPLLIMGDALPAIADKDKQRYLLALVDLKAPSLIWWRTSDWWITETNFGVRYDYTWARKALQPLLVPTP